MHNRLHIWFAGLAYELGWQIFMIYLTEPLTGLMEKTSLTLMLFACLRALLSIWNLLGLFRILSQGYSPWHGLTDGLRRTLALFRRSGLRILLFLILLLPAFFAGTVPVVEQGIRSVLLNNSLHGIAALSLLLLLVSAFLAWPALYHTPTLSAWIRSTAIRPETPEKTRTLNPLAAFVIAILLVLIQGLCCGLNWAMTARLYAAKGAIRSLLWILIPAQDLVFSTLAVFLPALLFIYGTGGLSSRSQRSHPERFLALCASLVLCLCLALPNAEPSDLKPVSKPFMVAHRGYADHVTENTMASFEKAHQAGARILELDVYQNPEGILYISHDQNLIRLTGKDIDLETASAEEISTAKTADGQAVPTLQEALDWAKETGMQLMIEIKSTALSEETAAKAAGMVKEAGLDTQCLIAGFRHNTLRTVRQIDPKIRTVMLLDFSMSDITAMEDTDIYSVEASCITPEMIRQAHEAGKRICAWTVNTRSQMDALLGMGVDGIVSDNTPEALAAVQQAESKETA